jgi:arylsulfatase A-like enzyme
LLSRVRFALALALLAGLLAAALAALQSGWKPVAQPISWLYGPPVVESLAVDVRALTGAASLGFWRALEDPSIPAVWAIGPESRVRFIVLEPRELELRLEACPAPGSRLLGLSVAWNGHEIGSAGLIEGRWHTQVLRVPARIQLIGQNWLALRHAAEVEPGQVRQRQAAYRRIELAVLDGAPGPLLLERAAAELVVEMPAPGPPPGARRMLLEQDEGPVEPGARLRPGPVQALVLREASVPRLDPFALPPAAPRLLRPRPLPGRTPALSALIVLLDACRADALGAYGSPDAVTPHLDRLARRSVLGVRAFSDGAYTYASVGALMSGIPSLGANLLTRDRRLAPEIQTLAEASAEAGLATAAFVASPYMSRAYGFDQGFATLVEFHRSEEDPRPGRRAWQVVASFERWLAQRPPEERFFAYVHLREPHQPYDPPPPLDRAFLPPGDSSVATGDNFWILGINVGQVQARREDIERIRGYYRGGLAVADAAVGRLLASLSAAGRADSTLVLLISDHGEAFFEHQRMTHNSTAYDEMLHIPWLLALPGAGQAVLDKELLGTVDVAPTLADALGLEPPAEASGLSQLAVLRGREPPNQVVTSHNAEKIPFLAWRTARFKLIDSERGDGGRLFDLLADPQENEDLAGRLPVTHGLLTLRLRAFLAKQQEAGRRRGRAEPVFLDAETEKELEALGYVE